MLAMQDWKHEIKLELREKAVLYWKTDETEILEYARFYVKKAGTKGRNQTVITRLMTRKKVCLSRQSSCL